MSSEDTSPNTHSTHRLRWLKLSRFLFSMVALSGAGVLTTVLSIVGELEWWASILGVVMLGLVGVGLRPLVKDLRMRLVLGPEGVSVNGALLLRWSEVVKVTYVRGTSSSGPQITGITLHTAAGLELTLGTDLTDWPVIWHTLARHFGPPEP